MFLTQVNFFDPVSYVEHDAVLSHFQTVRGRASSSILAGKCLYTNAHLIHDQSVTGFIKIVGFDTNNNNHILDLRNVFIVTK